MNARNEYLLKDLPDRPGVYLFYGASNELLYVGKSKRIRTRVRSHFSSAEERSLCRKVKRVEVRGTPGELGALLLESQLIKELGPMFNVAARHKRRIIVARRSDDREGYARIRLEAVDTLELPGSSSIMAIFKNRKQAREYLSMIARMHRLCPKLLGLEQSRKYCFAYHLGHCDGACMGEEEPNRYNVRLEEAFEARRIKAWPYDGGVVIEERSKDGREKELFFIDNWCLLASFRDEGGESVNMNQTHHRFDYDSYKLLYGFVTGKENVGSITVLGKEKFEERLNKEIKEVGIR